MFKSLLTGLAIFSTALALPLERVETQEVDAVDGTIQYVPVNGGWQSFPYGPVNSTTPVMFELFCPGRMNITDLGCSGSRFAVYDNGVMLGSTSMPVNNNCTSNSTNPAMTQANSNWSSGSYNLLPGWHNISIIPIMSPRGHGTGAIRVDTVEGPSPCTTKVCPHHKGDLVVVNTPVPRCQADNVCRSMGMHLAHIDVNNFLEATTLAFQCSGAFSQSWIDDWNDDGYMGTCLVLSTGGAAPGGAINVPSCCSTRLPVICQKEGKRHPVVHYSCNECQKSCWCKGKEDCNECQHAKCASRSHCGGRGHHGLLMD